MKTNTNIINLGFKNGWIDGKEPQLWKDCDGKNHKLLREQKSSYEEYYCPNCCIKWQIDSTG